MKHKFTSLILFLLVLVMQAHAQHGKSVWSAVIPNSGGYALINVCEDEQKNMYFLRADDKKNPTRFHLEIYDPKAVLKENCDFEIPVTNDHNANYLGSFASRGKFFLVSTTMLGTSAPFYHQAMCYQISKKGIETRVEMMKIPVQEKSNAGNFRFSMSPDKKKMLLFAEYPFEKDKNEVVKAMLFNPEEKIIYEKEWTLDIPFKNNIHNYPHVANNGDMYFVKKDKEKGAYRYIVYAYNTEGDVLTHKTITLPNSGHITDIRAAIGAKNEILVGGFYASEPVHIYQGYFLFGLDHSCGQTARSVGVLDEATLINFMSKKEISKDPSLRGFYLDKIVSMPGGGVYMISEKNNNEKKGVDDFYNYEEIMVMSFTAADKKFKKCYAVKKSQRTVNDLGEWSSYNIYHNGDTLGIVYNIVSQTEMEKAKKRPAGEKSNLLQTKIAKIHEKSGLKEITYNQQFDNYDFPMSFDPEIVYIRSDNALVLVFSALYHRHYRIGVLEM